MNNDTSLVITFRVANPRMKTQLAAVAKERDLTLSALIRQAIARFLADESAPSHAPARLP